MIFSKNAERWDTLKGQKFFDDFAKSRQFDPLKAENWYSVSKGQILRAVSACSC
jgi:hypothetical protein